MLAQPRHLKSEPDRPLVRLCRWYPASSVYGGAASTRRPESDAGAAPSRDLTFRPDNAWASNNATTTVISLSGRSTVASPRNAASAVGTCAATSDWNRESPSPTPLLPWLINRFRGVDSIAATKKQTPQRTNPPRNHRVQSRCAASPAAKPRATETMQYGAAMGSMVPALRRLVMRPAIPPIYGPAMIATNTVPIESRNNGK